MYVRPEHGGAYGIKRLGHGPAIGLVLRFTLLAALMVLILMGVIRYCKRKPKAKREKERAEAEAAIYQRIKASASIESLASSSTTSTPPVCRAPSYDTREQYPLYGSRGDGTEVPTPFPPNSHGVQVPPRIHTYRQRLPLKGGSIDSLTFAGDRESMIVPDDGNAPSTLVIEERRGSPASAGRGSPRSVGKGLPASLIRWKNRKQGSSSGMPLIMEVEAEADGDETGREEERQKQKENGEDVRSGSAPKPILPI